MNLLTNILTFRVAFVSLYKSPHVISVYAGSRNRKSWYPFDQRCGLRLLQQVYRGRYKRYNHVRSQFNL